MLDESIFLERLGEPIRQHILRRNLVDYYIPIRHQFPHVVVLDIDIFYSIVEFRVSHQLQARFVVAVD
jgi:hypothetical protein